MEGIVNFSAGPSALPAPVVARIRDDLPDWNGTGSSVVELSHRAGPFMALASGLEAHLRRMLAVPESHRIVFLQGGAQMQFAAVPLNLAGEGGPACYVDTGAWSARAIAEARRYCRVHVAASSGADGYRSIPPRAVWEVPPDCAYLHYVANETIAGVEFAAEPESGGVPLVADMSSNILSRPIDVARFGVVYAGAQKNMGVSGLTVVIVREDLLDCAHPLTPTVIRYAAQAEADSMANTPCTFAWYVASLVLEWIDDEGGLDAVAERNRRKAERLYRAIDASDLYSNRIEPASRSRMNVSFELGDDALDPTFLAESERAGLVGLKGHRSLGGMRASIYNAMPVQGVERLVAFLEDFERRHG
ncbi:MAG: 3-phosphoserine/phosphohydroxythreonine transaminase [Immundisolibacterales bacterium]|nr:3-phosphoserine/phosphohydroxythreonine transaminase [Immundisolibacterales bacterium]